MTTTVSSAYNNVDAANGKNRTIWQEMDLYLNPVMTHHLPSNSNNVERQLCC